MAAWGWLHYVSHCTHSRFPILAESNCILKSPRHSYYPSQSVIKTPDRDCCSSHSLSPASFPHPLLGTGEIMVLFCSWPSVPCSGLQRKACSIYIPPLTPASSSVCLHCVFPRTTNTCTWRPQASRQNSFPPSLSLHSTLSLPVLQYYFWYLVELITIWDMSPPLGCKLPAARTIFPNLSQSIFYEIGVLKSELPCVPLVSRTGSQTGSWGQMPS